MHRSADGTTYAAFAGAVVIGGSNFVAVSFSNMELPPVFGAALRFSLAAAIFTGLARLARVPPPPRGEMAGAAVYGLLGFGASYALLYYSLVGLPVGTVALIIAAVPLLTLALAVLVGQERFTVRGGAGGLLALAGIAVLSRGTAGAGAAGSYLVAALLGGVAIAASSVIARRLRGVHPLNMNAVGMVAGTLLLVAGSLLLGEAWALPRESRTWLAVAWLVLLGSVGLFQLFLFVIRRWSASATVLVMAGMPVVAASLGALLLDQPVTQELLAGGALVLLALYIGAVAPHRAARAATTVHALDRNP
jgi:drug/metabolite transporter (DMT)-like permease